MNKKAIQKIYYRLQEDFKPMDAHLFDLLVVRGRSVSEVAALTHLDEATVDAWRCGLVERTRLFQRALIRQGSLVSRHTDPWRHRPARGQEGNLCHNNRSTPRR